MTKKYEPEAVETAVKTSNEEIEIQKFIFRGSELVSFQVKDKIVSLDELIAMGNNFVYNDTVTVKDKDGNEKQEVNQTKIIVTDLGKGKYLSTKDKGDNIEKTFAKLI